MFRKLLARALTYMGHHVHGGPGYAKGYVRHDFKWYGFGYFERVDNVYLTVKGHHWWVNSYLSAPVNLWWLNSVSYIPPGIGRRGNLARLDDKLWSLRIPFTGIVLGGRACHFMYYTQAKLQDRRDRTIDGWYFWETPEFLAEEAKYGDPNDIDFDINEEWSLGGRPYGY